MFLTDPVVKKAARDENKVEGDKELRWTDGRRRCLWRWPHFSMTCSPLH